MKIGVWVIAEYLPHTGGAFSLYEKMIRLIDDYKFATGIDVCFIGHRAGHEYKFKKEYISLNPFRKSKRFAALYLETVSKISHRIKLLNRHESNFLKKHDVQLIYYPVQCFQKIPGFPFVSTNWDIGHKSSFAFPELVMNNTFEEREKWYSNRIYKALMVFAESEAGKQELLSYTQLNPERIAVLPLFPGGVADLEINEIDQVRLMTQYDLRSRQFFFYPAQFWAHKNHYHLLLAFKKIADEFPQLSLVLSGSDKGNKKYIKETAHSLGLSKQVKFPGFIGNDLLYTLYKNCIAMVMPSFVGPTNMPLLEARKLHCPVLCSDLKGHIEIMKDSAFYFSPDDHEAIYEKMKSVLDEKLRQELVMKANKMLENSIFTEQRAMKFLDDSFLKLKTIRSCWGENDKMF